MFAKILIANRGEIACRIARTARRLGIATVAVYSDADSNARHVAACDEAVHIGAAPPRESYLRIDAIVDAARRTRAEAIHPGYGFLSENEDFALACAKAGLVFIGPPVEAIRAMGSKSAAKTLMEKAGVPLVPGYHGTSQDAAFLKRKANEIGYPVLLKASAGGGGKGMRVVDHAEDFQALLASCKREAKSSFGDDKVLLERYLQRPRHIEIQVFADSQGNCVYLFERDCSVQRRHQKVLEEAPAPGMTEARRKEMGEAAVAAAKAVRYEGAGTVEFIASPDGTFYFMEMNTRLQVEHPVTEMITGLDLVEWQLRVAGGELLPLAQEQLSIRGHALEARIYAEDPSNGFLPSIGKLQYLTTPQESLHVRIDTGVAQGDEITPYYDPMIAKLIVWDLDRDRALERMLRALAQYRIVGVANNVDFLARVVASPAFAHADLDTALIEREKEYLFADRPEAPREAHLVATLATLLREEELARSAAARHGEPHSPWHLRTGWRLNSNAVRTITFRYHDTEKCVAVCYAEHGYRLELGGIVTHARGELGSQDTLRAELGGLRLDATVVVAAEKRHVFMHGCCHIFTRIDSLHYAGEAGAPQGGLVSPMPGRLSPFWSRLGRASRRTLRCSCWKQ
jgi:3-methylcrotonyl-CoA carboxylase alpha subunit